MGSRPHLSGTISERSVSSMWKFLILFFVVSSLATRTSYAKVTEDTDLIFDDVGTPAKELQSVTQTNKSQKPVTNELGSSLNNLESLENELDDDGMDLLDGADDDSNDERVAENSVEAGSWLSQSVSRVRREITRILGGSGEETENVKVTKPPKTKKNKKKDRKVNKTKAVKDKPKKDVDSLKEKTPPRRRRPLQEGRLKRQGIFNWFGAGNDDDEEDEDDEIGSGEEETYIVKHYRITFIVREIWLREFKDVNSDAFRNMSEAISIELVNLFDSYYKDLDEYFSMRAQVVDIAQTNDPFKIHVTADLEVTGDIQGEELNNKIRSKISYNQALGSISAEADQNYSFQQLEDFPITPPIESGKVYYVQTVDTGFSSSTVSSRCRDDEFTCRSGQCIDSSLRCDNLLDCEDESDEDDCMEKETTRPYPEQTATDTWWTPQQSGDNEVSQSGCRGDDIYVCQRSGSQICDVQRCDGVLDCPNGEDEEDCNGGGDVCESYEFACDGRCILLSQRCDGFTDCVDGADELECPSTESPHVVCRSDEFQCRDGSCIPTYKLCDRQRDCRDGDDEETCPAECSGNKYQCKDGSKCISDDLVCDGVDDCPSGDDEENCESGKFTCRDLSCISIVGRCDGKIDCPHDRSDEEGCPCLYDKWQCDDGTCIPIQLKCNGNIDCPEDVSDERNCNESEDCALDEFQCDNGQCLPLHLFCDQNYDCSDYSDEKSCSCSDDEFACTNGVCISSLRRCDGMFHCNDKSDEIGCDRTTTSTTSSPRTGKSSTCTRDEFTCISRDCIPRIAVCDGRGDCPNHEDESSHLCKCSSYEFKCLRGGGCIPKSYKCDGTYQCYDRSDEDHCHHRDSLNNTDLPHGDCLASQYRCADGICISSYKRCNGINDCADNSDEQNCPPSTNYDYDDESFVDVDTTSNCAPNEFQCDGSTCITIDLRCNGYPDCLDETDELDCPNLAEPECNHDEFQCDNGYCIPEESRCNGVTNCIDRTDEEACTSCQLGAYHCRSGECLQDKYRCDGNNDCSDGSDEYDCAQCSPYEFECGDGLCLNRERVCDGVPHCRDGSDEQGCDHENNIHGPCGEDQWQCGNGHCINSEFLCDNETDCYDGSDESYETCSKYENVETPDLCSYDEFFCDERCHPASIVCDGKPDCIDRRDEAHCPHYNTTTPSYPTRYPCPELTCPGNAKCYRYAEKCDGMPDCDDGYDERDCPCKENEFSCYDHQLCINVTLRCDGFYDCKDFSDEQYCFGCRDNQFKCNDGTCVAGSAKCNGRQECPDGSDELNCLPPASRCLPHQWTCDNGQCISVYARCDGRADCGDYSDERDCQPEVDGKECGPNMFRCENGPCISNDLRCNGRNDCPHDISDELDCGPITNEIITQKPPSDPQLNLKTYPSNQVIKESREVVFRCRDEGPTRARVKWSRPGGRSLPIGFTDVNGRLEIPNIRLEDAGEYVCEAVGYPTYTRGQSVSVHLTVEKYNPLLDRPYKACGYHEATCMNGECIPKSSICDGIPHCSDGSDEHSCSRGRKCDPNQFMCKNSKCVDRTWRCDGEDDCGDRSDEESCDPNPSESPCKYDEFQCRTGHCIPKSFHCDGTNDCRDGSDEIGCMAPAVISPPPPRVDIPIGGILNITCRATGVPTPIVVWRLNWGHVPDNCASTSDDGFGNLICNDMQPVHSGAYSCEIINVKGGLVVTPDTIVTVIDDRRDVCPSGFFNALALRRDECLNCFCFGVSNQCKSADMFVYNLPPPITSHRVVGVEIQPHGDISIDEFSGHDLISLRHGVQFRASNLPYTRQVPYLALPEDYLGSQLKSYGGNIKYEAQFIGNGRPTTVPDVILVGNGYKLSYHSRQNLESNIRNEIAVQFATGQWTKTDGRLATREELMMALADVQHLLIRLQYIDSTEREVELTHITMDSAGLTDVGLGPASLVEQCTCPTGYMGISCERCAPGFVRQRGGAWLGRCIPEPLPTCQTGTYGDPSRGIPCRPCPCPLTNPENNFARECSLGPDGDVICHCQRGYTGRRCEICEEGYQGNPMQPGGSCQPIPSSRCDPLGTNYTNPDGSCSCKPLVTGAYCDLCAPGTFHLNEFYPLGCIECFCSGVTQSCSSSNWYRDTIRSQFNGRTPHGFEVISNTETPVRGHVQVIDTGREIEFEDSYITDVLYWSLPSKYLGNQLGVFGGVLNYTLRYSPMPGGLMSKNTAPDVVLKSANDIILTYFRKTDVPPSVYTTHTIPMIDTDWRRQDKGKYNRAYFLMALADIEAIYIKATYTTTTKEAALQQVSLDTATRSNIGTARAVEVEQCACPVGYTGLSCERCAPGFKRSPEAGLYLGFCEPCECNGHSNECDAETGVCLNCRDNTEGEMCDNCAPGFSGNATGGTPYDCRPEGGLGSTICNCDYRGYVKCEGGYCQCKTNVVGFNCDRCREGTFNLNENDPDGCSECFCSGVSTTCAKSYYKREQLPIALVIERPSLTDYEGNVIVADDFDVDLANNQVSFNKPTYSTQFWSLPNRLLGAQVRSYGGNLHLTLRTESYGNYVPDQDIIIRGNGIKLYWSRPPGTENDEQISVRLHESEGWYKQDQNGVHPASRTDIMTVLSNLDHILVRANPKSSTTFTSLRDVILDTAVQGGYEDDSSANEVEACVCPPGYDGTSCEACAKLYYRNESNIVGLFGACMQCPCGEGAESCSMQPNGIVECHCMRGFSGDRCQYRAATGPKPEAVLKPNCSYHIHWIHLPRSSDEMLYLVTKDKKLVGELYLTKHSNCTRDSTRKRIGDDRPATQRPYPKPEVTISVTISTPVINIISIGESITLECSGQVIVSQNPISVNWYKLGGRLPSSAVQDRGRLYLSNVQVPDSGTYVCQAQREDEVVSQQITITVTPEVNVPSRPTISVTPPNVDVEEYQPVEVYCDAKGYPRPSVTWTRIDAPISANAYSDGKRLSFTSIRQEDQGSYRCHAQNNLGSDDYVLYVYVRPAYGPPLPPPGPTTPGPSTEIVYIEPPSFIGHIGDLVTLNCRLRTTITVTYEWLKDDYDIYRNRNVDVRENTLTIREASVGDSGVYTCRAVDPRSGNIYTSVSYVTIDSGGAPPRIHPLQNQHLIIQGQDLNITCETTGTPYPTVKWTKLHESLDPNVQQTGNALRILNAQPKNRGVYVCIAESPAGADQTSTVIDVEPRERPMIEIHPRDPQTVRVGESAMLSCRAIAGIPEPRITWNRVDRKPMPTKIREDYPGTITFTDVDISDAGEYECRAENAAGMITATTSISIAQPPIVTIHPNQDEIELTEGDELRLICMSTGYPQPTLKWLDPNERVLKEQPYSAVHRGLAHEITFDIYHVSMQDAKLYSCHGTNSGGDDRKYINVRVKPKRGDVGSADVDEPPTPYPGSYPDRLKTYLAELGDRTILSCNIAQPTMARTTWERVDGRPLPQRSQVIGNDLIIHDLTEDAAGTYRCFVIEHNRKTPLITAELVLSPIPRIAFSPPMPMTVRAGETVNILCNATGEQPIYVEWHAENHRPLPSSVRAEGPYLRFEAIKPADAGRYYCTASNRRGNVTKVAEVLVNRETVTDRPSTAQVNEVYEGQGVSLDCDVGHDFRIRPDIRFTWRRQDGRLSPNARSENSRLFIQYVRREDEGRYVCEVISPQGIIATNYVDLILKRYFVPKNWVIMKPVYTTCKVVDFKCISHPHTCISPSRVCDGIYDCTDHSDELNCSQTKRYKRWKKDRIKMNNIGGNLPVLKLDPPQSFLRVGESTEVECRSSDAYVDVIWERADGRRLPPNIRQVGNKLVIENADIHDSGDYICRCRTGEGDVYSTNYELNIQPTQRNDFTSNEVSDTPRQLRKPKVEHAEVGSTVILNCDAEDPRATFKWARQYGQFPPGKDLQSSQLILNNVQANDAGSYICTASHNGISEDTPITLVVTGAIPHFHQAPLSYMTLPTLPNAFFKFNLDITFKPEQPNGLILYNGQKRGNGDYIALSLNDNYPEFRFDFGSSPTTVRSNRPITLGEWHTIKISRSRKDGLMIVDDQSPVAFPPQQTTLTLDLLENLYIGAVPRWEDIPSEAVARKTGFVGCVSRLVLQDKVTEFNKDALYKEGITSCEPCADEPCENEGICLESQTETGYTCICQEGYTGKTCAVEGNSCTPGVCGFGRCENTDTGIECFCPLNRTGNHCEYAEYLEEGSLSFKDGSYAAYKTPRPSKLNLKFHIHPNNLEDGIVLYVAESERSNGDFVAVIIKNKHLELKINTGARLKPVVVRSLHPIPAHKWTEVEIGRRMGEGFLKVGNEPEQTGKASGPARSLYLKTKLYIGGYDKRILLNRDMGVTRGFDGCVSNLQESSRKVNMIADIIDAANVQNCRDNNEITPPAVNGNEHYHLDSCASEPCENGGTCVPNGDEFSCNCPLGYDGRYCEEHILLHLSAHFRGNGYLELDRIVVSNSTEQFATTIAVLFSTSQPNGLLLWYGQEKGQAYVGQDYIALAVVDGILECSYRLDGEEAVIRTTSIRVDDGRRHVAIIKRSGNQASLELDHLSHYGETRPTAKNEMHLPGHLFIGGAQDLVSFTGNRYTHGFTGCIHAVEGEVDGGIILGRNAISGINVDSCPNDDINEELEGPEPPVV